MRVDLEVDPTPLLLAGHLNAADCHIFREVKRKRGSVAATVEDRHAHGQMRFSVQKVVNPPVVNPGVEHIDLFQADSAFRHAERNRLHPSSFHQVQVLHLDNVFVGRGIGLPSRATYPCGSAPVDMTTEVTFEVY